MQADKEVVMAAVQQTGEALSWASSVLQADKEVVMAALQQHGRALQHMPRRSCGPTRRW